MAENISDIWEPFHTAKQQFSLVDKEETNVLSEQQQFDMKEKALYTQIANLEYLNTHPEVRAIIRALFAEIVKVQPFDVRKFFRNFFSRPRDSLDLLINDHLNDFPVMDSRPAMGRMKPAKTIQTSIASTNVGLAYSCCDIYFPPRLCVVPSFSSLGSDSSLLIKKQNLNKVYFNDTSDTDSA